VSDLARLVVAELERDPTALDRLSELVRERPSDTPTGAGLVPINAAAARLGVSPKTIRRRIADRTLPAVLDRGRLMVRTDELTAYIDSLARPGGRAATRRRRPTAGRFDFLRQ
jgi:excisionase family DNA binding protein